MPKHKPLETESQEDKILKYLKKGHRLTPIEALEKFGCFRLGARVWNLKHIQGHPIESEMVDDPKTGKRYASYFIAGLTPPKKERVMKGKTISDFSRAIAKQVPPIQTTLF